MFNLVAAGMLRSGLWFRVSRCNSTGNRLYIHILEKDGVPKDQVWSLLEPKFYFLSEALNYLNENYELKSVASGQIA